MPSLNDFAWVLQEVRPKRFIVQNSLESILEMDPATDHIHIIGNRKVYETRRVVVSCSYQNPQGYIIHDIAIGRNGSVHDLTRFWNRARDLMQGRPYAASQKPHPTLRGVMVNDRMPDQTVTLEWLKGMMGADADTPIRELNTNSNGAMLYLIESPQWRVWFLSESNGHIRVDNISRPNRTSIMSGSDSEEDRLTYWAWLGLEPQEPPVSTIENRGELLVLDEITGEGVSTDWYPGDPQSGDAVTDFDDLELPGPEHLPEPIPHWRTIRLRIENNHGREGNYKFFEHDRLLVEVDIVPGNVIGVNQMIYSVIRHDGLDVVYFPNAYYIHWACRYAAENTLPRIEETPNGEFRSSWIPPGTIHVTE